MKNTAKEQRHTRKISVWRCLHLSADTDRKVRLRNRGCIYPLTTRKYPFFTLIRHLVCHLSAGPALPTQGEAFGPRTGDFLLYGTVPRASMPNGKQCKMSLGLELSLRASSLYIYDIIEIGRNARAFLENAAVKHRLRTAWGSVYVYCFVSLAFG